MTVESRLIPILRQGVDMVRMIAFKRFREALSGPDTAAISKMAGALVNAIFDPASTDSPDTPFAPEQRKALEQQLAKAADTLGELRIPVTDALRIQALCDHQEGMDSTATLKRAMELGILLAERDLPLPHTFLHLVRTLGQAWGLLTPPSQPA